MAGTLEPDPQSAFDAFASAARRWRDRPFLVVLPETANTYGIAAETLSYGAMLDMIERRRVEFERAAYASGDRVGLLLENRPSFFVSWLALNALGVSVVPI
jgi:acyl-CoA synthetase (AMP-forming)/AMP-acid ligase II